MEYGAPRTNKVSEMEIEHMQVATEIAGECVVLLENRNCLPLSKVSNIALYGSGARQTVKGGTGSGEVNSRDVINFEQGLEEAGFCVTTKSWLDRYDQTRKEALLAYGRWTEKEAKRKGIAEFLIGFYSPFKEPAPDLVTDEDIKESNTDTAVYVIARNSGEGADRQDKEGDYQLFQEEIESLRILGKAYQRVIVVLNVGGVIDLSKVCGITGVGAIILTAQLGNIGGNILPKVLLGEINPSGKLVDTWAKSYQDYPSALEYSHNNGNVDDEFYKEGIYVGYRYFDSFSIEPEYCFGFGRSYTTFDVVTKEVMVEGKTVTVSVQVRNTGKLYAGKEVIQLYVSKPSGRLDQPYQELICYTKTKELAPGEEQILTLSFSMDQCASYCEKNSSYILEKGKYLVRIGTSSRDHKVVAALEMKKDKIIVQCKKLFKMDCSFEEKKNVSRLEENIEKDLPHFVLEDSAFSTTEISYHETREEFSTDKKTKLTMSDVQNGDCTLEELVAQLTVEELAVLCVGSGGTEAVKEKEESIVGNASRVVPGAAGDSTSLLLKDRGIKNMIQADGPAGLRLQSHFKTTADHVLLPGGEMLPGYIAPFDEDALPKDAIDYYQYCTAIPIGWALAHTWNDDLITRAGDMIGEEMELFQIDLWLAPAMNIHRNPLCGRNFEYYSEDPVISGKMAAAMTRGVQKHKGKGTTIKHFAANNQEDNRYFTNAHISERALREIYLKGYEIAIKESNPLSVMSSYNLINGIHAANHKDLMQFVLRDEWGFDGFVMTDWFATQDSTAIMGTDHKPVYPYSSSVGCIYAGNDLQMPGCVQNVRDLIEAVLEEKEMDGYKITLADLQFCAANIIRVAAKM